MGTVIVPDLQMRRQRHRCLVSYSRSHTCYVVEVGLKPSLLAPNWCMSGNVCVRVYLCVTSCSQCVRVWMHVCMHKLYICVRGKARIQVQICLMHSYTVFSQLKNENSNGYFCLTLRSAEFSCVHCLNWIKQRYNTQSSIYTSESLPGKWKWRGWELW